MLPKRSPHAAIISRGGEAEKVDLRASFVALGVSNLEIRHFKTSAYLGNAVFIQNYRKNDFDYISHLVCIH